MRSQNKLSQEQTENKTQGAAHNTTMQREIRQFTQ